MKKILIAVVLLLLPLSAYTTMIVVAYSNDAGPIERQAYERSRSFDQEKAERKRFDALGLRLACKPDQGQARFFIDGADQTLGDAQLVFKRPDNIADDFSVEWEPGRSIAFSRRGWWLVELHGTYDGEPVRSKTEIYIP